MPDTFLVQANARRRVNGDISAGRDTVSIRADAGRRVVLLLGLKFEDCPQPASNGNDSGANPPKSRAIGRVFQKRPKNIEHLRHHYMLNRF
jgi:hypothetical protein